MRRATRRAFPIVTLSAMRAQLPAIGGISHKKRRNVCSIFGAAVT